MANRKKKGVSRPRPNIDSFEGVEADAWWSEARGTRSRSLLVPRRNVTISDEPNKLMISPLLLLLFEDRIWKIVAAVFSSRGPVDNIVTRLY